MFILLLLYIISLFHIVPKKKGAEFQVLIKLSVVNEHLSQVWAMLSPFSFRRREMNFLGGMTPTFFFCVAMEWKRSARHVSRFSFFFCWALYASTFSRNGRQKYRAWSTELQ